MLKKINARIRTRLHSQDDFLNALLRYAAQTKGKQLRVRLTLLSAQLCGRINQEAEALAVALELFHYATLVHDDVIDKSGRRRHGMTMNARHGNEIAVLAGDFLFTQVMQILFEEVPKKIQGKVIQAAGMVCFGEIQERQYRGAVSMTVAQYRQVIENKTASLFTACCQCGGAVTGGKKKQIEQLTDFGRAYGMAFQIQDDILDFIGNPAKTGKAAGQDLREGRITLPVILGLKRLRGTQRRVLHHAVKSGTFRIGSIKKILVENGLIQEAQAIAQMFIKSAEQRLRLFPDSKPRQMMLDMAAGVANREH